MRLISAFLKLIRWPNLLFIALTQILFRYFMLPFAYLYSEEALTPKINDTLFFYLMIASVCIAAAGYIINDYFDLNIDTVNKPRGLIIDRFIKRRWAIIWHIVLSSLGLALSLYIGYRLRNAYIPALNLLAIFLLWYYSAALKKKFLIGNVLISLLTAWVILVLTTAEFRFDIDASEGWKRLLKFSFIYAGFAFIISLIREVIKDMEDIRGDEKYKGRTMPIVWGIPVSKMFVAVWIIVLISAIIILLIYIVQLGWWLTAIYSLFFIILPLGWLLRELYAARVPGDFKKLSKAVKFVMLTGMISMIFFSMAI